MDCPNQTEQDLTSLRLTEVAYLLTSHTFDNKFLHCTKRGCVCVCVDSEGLQAANRTTL